MTDREKLIELLMDKPFGNSTEEREIAHAEDVAEYLISNGVTVRERGRWIEVDDGVLIGQGKHYECSKCGTWTTPWRLSDYCPYCGADMRPKGEGEEDG